MNDEAMHRALAAWGAQERERDDTQPPPAEPDRDCPRLTRFRTGLLREDWTPEEAAHLAKCKRCERTRERVAAQLWRPSHWDLVRYHVGQLDPEAAEDIRYHLEVDKCKRSLEILARIRAADAWVREPLDAMAAVISRALDGPWGAPAPLLRRARPQPVLGLAQQAMAAGASSGPRHIASEGGRLEGWLTVSAPEVAFEVSTNEPSLAHGLVVFTLSLRDRQVTGCLLLRPARDDQWSDEVILTAGDFEPRPDAGEPNDEDPRASADLVFGCLPVEALSAALVAPLVAAARRAATPDARAAWRIWLAEAATATLTDEARAAVEQVRQALAEQA